MQTAIAARSRLDTESKEIVRCRFVQPAPDAGDNVLHGKRRSAPRVGCREQDSPRGSKGRSGSFMERRPLTYFDGGLKMPRNIYVVLYVLVLIAVVVGIDLLFFQNRFWERLILNIGIVLVFAAFYLRFLKKL
jgi:hypothetical protein